ncbi:hypothetical protein EVAR_41171_1 [Eumeta japonica]|uniref:Uncharacterized protein n=1 Tax=Eumeta variegata TaxID=151549 RepID=A0A4C1YC54_EUMVA|nr:hypothetical protein EVAR_41171_1 [Eumeta japonica]
MNSWSKPLPWVKPQHNKEINFKNSPQQTFSYSGTEAMTLGEDINTIMSILQVVKSAEVVDLAVKFRKTRHGVDRLRIILENQELISKLERLQWQRSGAHSTLHLAVTNLKLSH